MNDSKWSWLANNLFFSMGLVRRDGEDALLGSVGEVVVAGGHVVILTRVELQEGTNERSRGVVQERVDISTSAGRGKLHNQIGLVCLGDGGLDVLPHGVTSGGRGVVDVSLVDLDNIGTISTSAALAGVSSLSIATVATVVMGV